MARRPAGRACYGRRVAPTRFVADRSLTALARWLRFLGYDVRTVPGARLEEVFEAARREGRTVLTPSLRRPRRWAGVPALTVARDRDDAEVRRIAAAHEPSGPPFSRCGACGAALETRLPAEARGEVPSRVLRAARELRSCPGCGRWYWEGTHVRAIRAWLERALGRPLGPGVPRA
jgi:uncharacterized protein